MELVINQISIVVTEEGFLCSGTDWNEQVAEEIAKAESILLTPAHWELINFVRYYYQTFKHLPNLRLFIKAVAKELTVEKGNSRYVQLLFPQTPLKSLCKIAGLPKPPYCL